MARYLKKRKRGFYLALPVPAHLRHHFGGKSMIETTLATRDERLAEARAQRLAGEYKLRFMQLEGNPYADPKGTFEVYQSALQEVRSGAYRAYAGGEDPEELGVSMAIDAIVDPAPIRVDEDGEPVPVLTPEQEARVAGLADGLSELTGHQPRYRERFEPPFRILADRWLEGWKATPGRRASNTGSQYGSAIRLFAEFWGDRPLREVRRRDGAEFVELLKRLPANHGRGKLVGMPLKQAVELHGSEGADLSAPVIKRHLLVLKQIWGWAEPQGVLSRAPSVRYQAAEASRQALSRLGDRRPAATVCRAPAPA